MPEWMSAFAAGSLGGLALLLGCAVASGGLPVTIAGFKVGEVAFVGPNAWLARRGARHCKRSWRPSAWIRSGTERNVRKHCLPHVRL